MKEATTFLRAHTAVARAPLVPEIALHLATDITPIWEATEAWLEREGVAPPFWAFAWPGSVAVARLISTVMKRGKKSLAERIVYTAIDKSRENSEAIDPLEVVNKALENVRPRLEVKSRRVGGATYQVPMEVTPARQVSLAMRWIVTYADNRRGMPMADALAAE